MNEVFQQFTVHNRYLFGLDETKADHAAKFAHNFLVPAVSWGQVILIWHCGHLLNKLNGMCCGFNLHLRIVDGHLGQQEV